jgi:ABC-2 type transport system ATP-binding protein
VELVGIRHRYRGVGEVLAGVDLEVAPGRPAVVVGGNGSGKSTLLRIAAGCLAPGSGTVRRRPEPIGYLPAPFPTTPRLTVRRYLHHLDAVHGLARHASLPVLEALRFRGDLDGPVSALSTGNATTVGLAQALAVGRGLVVLDEPWTALDEPAAEALTDLLAASSATVLLTDHSGRATALPGATVHRLADGRLSADGPATWPIPRWARVELICPEPADRVARHLPAVASTTCAGAVLVATLAQGDVDRWLAAALAAGCSVVAVRRSTEPS